MPPREKPGPMGWWKNEHDSPLRTMYWEHRQLESMPDVRKPAKAVEPSIIKFVRARMAEDGMEGGTDLTYLEPLVFGDFLQWRRQLIGSCVASGGMRGWTSRALWEIVALGQAEEALGGQLTGRDNLAHFGPYNYRAGRRIAGINGGDGSFCSAHIEGFQKWGALPCQADTLTSDAFPEPQDTGLYRRWGNSNQLLERFAPQARHLQLTESRRIRSADDAKAAVAVEFKPLMICSNWAFKPDYESRWEVAGKRQWIYQRDRGSSWAHNMTIVAVVHQADGKWYGKVKNSWGMHQHRSGDHFWIPLEVLATWLRDAVCMTIGDIDLIDSPEPVV